MLKRFICLVGVFSLLSCTSDKLYAPVSDRYYQNADTQNYYTVREGDSVYSIAWAYGLDYRDLAAANGLVKPYRMSPGKRLQVRGKVRRMMPAAVNKRVVRNNQGVGQLFPERVEVGPTSSDMAPPIRPYGLPSSAREEGKSVKAAIKMKAEPKSSSKPVQEPIIVVSPSPNGWMWPTKGKVVSRFVAISISGNKGIDIQGTLGQPIRAAAAGKVVYSGSGVRGYGNLIIIKHNQNYLSAYAYNQRLLVKEGDNVVGGQTIAEMGKAETGRVLLHFEIRYNGQPVDPMAYLK